MSMSSAIVLANKHQQCLELKTQALTRLAGESEVSLHLKSRIEVEEPINLLLDNCLIALGQFQSRASVEKFLALSSRYEHVYSLLKTLRDIDDDACVAYGGGDCRCEVCVWEGSSVDYVLDEVEITSSSFSVRVRLLKTVAFSDHSGITVLDGETAKVTSVVVDRDSFDSDDVGLATVEMKQDFPFTTFRIHQPRALPRTDVAKDGEIITPRWNFGPVGKLTRLGFKFRLEKTKNNDPPLVCIDIIGA